MLLMYFALIKFMKLIDHVATDDYFMLLDLYQVSPFILIGLMLCGWNMHIKPNITLTTIHLKLPERKEWSFHKESSSFNTLGI